MGADVTSAFEAEVEVSRLLGTAYQLGRLGRPGVVEALSGELLDEAVVSRHPGAFELLTILAAIGPDEILDEAAEALSQREHDDPEDVADWCADVGRWTLTRTLRVGDDDGDVEQWMAVFAGQDGREDHALIWLVDVWDSSTARDVYAVQDLDEAFAAIDRLVAEDPELRLEHPEPTLLRAVVGEAMRLADMTVAPDPEDVDEDDEAVTYAWFRALAHARLRLLPPPAQLPEPLDEDDRESLVDAFVDSPLGRELTHPSGGGDVPEEHTVRFIAELLVDHAVDYTGGEPLRISPLTVEVFMLDWVHRKAMLDPDDVSWLPDIVKAWVRYAFDTTGRPVARRDATLAAVDDFAPEFRRLAGTGEGRGLASELVAGFLDDGVDIADPAQLEAAIRRYNDSLPDD